MSNQLRELLLTELREAVAARILAGADPHEMTAELTRRLRRIRRMQEDDARLRPGPPAERCDSGAKSRDPGCLLGASSGETVYASGVVASELAELEGGRGVAAGRTSPAPPPDGNTPDPPAMFSTSR